MSMAGRKLWISWWLTAQNCGKRYLPESELTENAIKLFIVNELSYTCDMYMYCGRTTCIHKCEFSVKHRKCLRNHPSQGLMIKCLTLIQVELEFRNVGFWGEGRAEYPEKNLSEQSREPTTHSTYIWCRLWKSNAWHIGGRRTLSALCQPCSLLMIMNAKW